MKRSFHLLLGALPLLAGAWSVQGSGPVDPVAALRADLAAGRKTLAYEPEQGYLRALLEELKIDPSSQTLVFSKTSLQTDFISRRTPRAIYFNEDTYVGWIPGAPLIEIMSVHPTRGIVFFTLPNVAPKPGAKPGLGPEDRDCTRCHGGRVPTLFANSVFTAPSGYPRVFSRSFDVTPRLPLRQRWGGWYVTGRHNGQRHMGNVLSLGTDEKPTLDAEGGANITDLNRYFDTKRYLTPHSDIVALMVMEAQMDVQNAIVSAGLRTRPRAGEAAPSAWEIAEACEPLVEVLLGGGEVQLTSPITGTGEFSRVFAASGPKDAQSRSLTELDLKTRLLKYACSPLIYSRSFDALPGAAQDQIWRRFREILAGKDPDGRFAHLSPADRQALREILSETKPSFARALTTSQR